MIQAEQWFPDKPVEGVMTPQTMTQFDPYIRTLEGDHLVSPGDWVITGIIGEKYCCKDYIFKDLYVPVFGDEAAKSLGWDDLDDYERRSAIFLETDEMSGFS